MKLTISKVSFRERVALLRNSPIIRVVKSKKKKKWDARRRLRVSLASNNGGVWWVCLATRTVADIERRLREGSVAALVYQTVGGILGDHTKLKHTGRKWYLYVQLTRRDELVDLVLREIGLEPQEQIRFDQIRHP